MGGILVWIKVGIDIVEKKMGVEMVEVVMRVEQDMWRMMGVYVNGDLDKKLDRGEGRGRQEKDVIRRRF